MNFIDECFERTEAVLLFEKLRSSGPFNFQNWKKETPQAQFRSLGQNFQILGTGSSRQVFLLSSRFVMKYAINSKGVAQNKAEVKFAADKTLAPALSGVQDGAPDGQWVMAQLVRPLKNWNEFQSIKGYPVEILAMAMNHQWEPEDINQVPNVSEEQKQKAFQDINFLNAVAGLIRKGLLTGDMKFHDHWGKTPDGRVVMLDYGFDAEVANKEYGHLGGAGSEDATRKPSAKTAPGKPTNVQ